MNKTMKALLILSILLIIPSCTTVATRDKRESVVYNYQVTRHAGAMYPNAKIYTLDHNYSLSGEKEIKESYSHFISKMRQLGLNQWVEGKLDCDKWSWLYKAEMTIQNALSDRKSALPVGILFYHVNADKSKPHCINVIIYEENGHRWLTELNSQPNKGFLELTKEERETAWLVIF
jgi:hypothetical protein